MFKYFIEQLKKSRFILRIALSTIPFLLLISRGKSGIARIAYRVYSITPVKLAVHAAKSSSRAAVLARSPNERALLTMVSTRFSFDHGNNLESWEQLSHRALQACDDAIFQDATVNECADLIFEALQVLFHPSIHQSTRSSPIVDSPELVQQLMSYECMLRLTSQKFEQDLGKKIRVPITDRATRVLILTDTNFNFMGPILDAFETDPKCEVLSRNLLNESVDPSWWNPRNTIIDRLTGNSPEPPDALVEDLNWADVVFVEWSQALAARLSGTNLTAAIIIRLHKYEAFIPTPTLTLWENVESLITITPYMESVLSRTVPHITARTTIHMVPNVTDLQHFNLPKTSEAAKTIGVIQYASVVKDPMWALDVLKILLQYDSEWKLRYVGSPFVARTASESEKAYFELFFRRARTFGEAVSFLGRRSDLDEVFRSIGVLLSCSMVEGAPVSVIEGVASGALPVIRNWPILKAVHAAESLYPAEWVVERPEDAAARILEWSENTNQPVGEVASSSWAIENFDSTIIFPKLRQTIFGRGTA